MSWLKSRMMALLAVPGGPTRIMCSPAMALTRSRRMISCLSRKALEELPRRLLEASPEAAPLRAESAGAERARGIAGNIGNVHA
jgi:hypothetical protein